LLLYCYCVVNLVVEKIDQTTMTGAVDIDMTKLPILVLLTQALVRSSDYPLYGRL
jgi:hypothetical protein